MLSDRQSSFSHRDFQVVVCIIADGRKKVHPRVLDCLTLLGVYQAGDHMKNMINGVPVTAHLFEYTTSFALDSNLHFKYPDKGIVPTQIIFCMKEKNQKKINSHRWFFNAFGSLLQVCAPAIPLARCLRVAAQRMHLIRCWYATREHQLISFMESVRSQLQCCWCMWRNFSLQREKLVSTTEPIRFGDSIITQVSVVHGVSSCSSEL